MADRSKQQRGTALLLPPEGMPCIARRDDIIMLGRWW
jgi:hypothetical protein